MLYDIQAKEAWGHRPGKNSGTTEQAQVKQHTDFPIALNRHCPITRYLWKF